MTDNLKKYINEYYLNKISNSSLVFSIFSVIGINLYYLIFNFSKVGHEEIDIGILIFSSLVFILFIFFIDNKYLKTFRTLKIQKRTLSSIEIFLWFIPFLILFIVCPWTSDKSTFLHSITAICRIIWLFIGVRLDPLRYSKYLLRSPQTLYLFLTVILAFVDQSRSLWFLSFLMVSVISMEISSLFFSCGLLFILLCAIAGIRSGWAINSFISTAVIGEAGGATWDFMAMQGFSIDNIFSSFLYILDRYLAFLTTPLNKLLQVFDFAEFSFSNISFNQYLEDPMGGWFIGNEFAFYGDLQYFLVYFYMATSYVMSIFFISPISPVLARLAPIIALKSTPFIYWNFVYYLLVIGIIFFAFKSIQLKS